MNNPIKQYIRIGLVFTAFWFASHAAVSQSFAANELKSWQKQAKNVEIIRDEWGVPHIYGKTDADAVFGMIYAQAEDDYRLIEEKFIQKIGMRAYYLGEQFVLQDLYNALFIDTAKAHEAYLKLPPYYRGLLDAHAGGLNYYLYKHPEKAKYLKRYEPWYQLMGSGPSGHVPMWAGLGLTADEVNGYLKTRCLDGLTGVDMAVADAGVWLKETDMQGSNGWAMGKGMAEDGHTYLLINPHASVTVNSLRLEVHMASREGLNVYGSPFTGDMILWNAFNENLGWAHTAQYSDQADLYNIHFDHPEKQLAYRYGSGYLEARERIVPVKYRAEGGQIKESRFSILETDFGPVVARMKGVHIAIKDTVDMERYLRQNWDFHKNESFAAYRKTLEMTAEKANTITYADREGNIAYWHTNVVPRRDPTFDWFLPVDAAPETRWKGLHHPDEIPHVINPPSGVIHNENCDPWIIALDDSPDSLAYPPYMSYDPRSLRSVFSDRVFRQKANYTFAEFEEAALRNGYLIRFEMLFPSLFEMYAQCNDPKLKAQLEAPMSLLADWDFRPDTAGVATTLAVLLEERLDSVYRGLHTDRFQRGRDRYRYEYTDAFYFPGHVPLECLAKVVAKLKADFGTWRVAWGEINRLQRIAPDSHLEEFDDNRLSYAVAGAPNPAGNLFDYQTEAFSGNRRRYGTKGNTFVAVVDFGEKVRARTVLVGGQSSDPASKHFFDQGAIYAKGQLKDIYFYREDVKQQAVHTYKPGEEWRWQD